MFLPSFRKAASDAAATARSAEPMPPPPRRRSRKSGNKINRPPPRAVTAAALALVALFVMLGCGACAFLPPPAAVGTTRSTTPTLNMGFLDSLTDAFSNDPNLSKDKSEQQLEGPGIDLPADANLGQKTEVQRRWLENQSRSAAAKNAANARVAALDAAAGNAQADIVVTPGKGAPVDATRLIGTQWTLDLYLAGVPTKDPSNDLYGARTNISNRDKSLPLGLALPEEPSCSITIELGEDAVCRVVDGGGFCLDGSDGTKAKVGQWIQSPDGRSIRFGLDTLGYTRTVTTRGTIQKVFWSDGENEVTSKTSTVYSINPGWVYGDVGVGYGSRPGELVMLGLDDKDKNNNMGLLQVERKQGLLGAASKMVPCGKFVGRQVLD